MKTIRIETVAIILDCAELEKARQWCHQNGVTVHKKGIIEFVILEEFKNEFKMEIKVGLKKITFRKERIIKKSKVTFRNFLLLATFLCAIRIK